MRGYWLFALALCGVELQAGACLPGSLDDYFSLGSTGCSVGALQFADFSPVPGISFATAIDPSDVQVTPIGGFYNPSLMFTFNSSAALGDLLESIFRFSVMGAVTGASIRLESPSATGDGAVTGILDVCAGGSFSGDQPIGCSGSPSNAIAFFIAGDHQLFANTGFPANGFADVFADLTIDAGPSGTASLASATIGFVAVPEASTFAATILGLSLLFYLRRLRRSQSFRRIPMLRSTISVILTLMLLLPNTSWAANHREAPITSLDHKADITDVYAFRSYGGSSADPRVTLILCVDPLLEPANGPNYWPFDPDITYEIKVDNNNDAIEDIVFQFRFKTEQRLPNLFQVYAGVGNGVNAPANSPAPVAPGTPIVPPKITSFQSAGLGQRQSYTVNVYRPDISMTPLRALGGEPFYAVPANVGPRTMDYSALFNAGTYSTDMTSVKVFAGTVDDPFWIDLGGAFDTLNLRSTVAPGVLTPAQDAAKENIAADTVSGYAVNAIAIEVPVSMLTRTHAVEPASSQAATIGVWGTTSRMRVTARRAPLPASSSGGWSQIQRMGNPLINELLIGTGFKDRFSMDQPKNDAQFANFFLDPTLARVLNAATGGAVAIPTPPRTDLLPLVTYAPPIAATGTPSGPVADLLRLNTGVAPTAPEAASRLGLLGGDPAGFPNGRRLFDDVTDIALRAVAGVLRPGFNVAPNNRLGDGVNVNDAPYHADFPYLADAPSGRDRRHIDPGEPGCTAGSGPACPQ